MIKNVTEWLEATARNLPDKVAFSDGGQSLTFAELRAQGRACATALARRGLFKQPVAVAMGRGPHIISAFMGAAYSGNFYVPLDLEMPAYRALKILEKVRPAACLADPEGRELLSACGLDAGLFIPFAEAASSAVDDGLLAAAEERQIDADLLYVMFTSGSTGEPKGVCACHGNVIDYINALKNTFEPDSDTIFGQIAPFTFDASILYIYLTLQNGYTCYVIPKVCAAFAAKMVDFLNEHQINTIYWVPTAYNIIAKSGILAKRPPRYVRRLWFAGEVMPNSLLNIWRRALPEAECVNLFGPTEITGTFLHYILDRDFAHDEPLPVGKPYRNVDVLILDERNRPCPAGETGELCVRGAKVALGYYNDPERTAEVFVQNPLNQACRDVIYRTGDFGYLNERGEIMFVGRKDHLIKHLGYRIELGEIEATAVGLDGVELCACVYDDKNQRLVLFYSGEGEEKRVADELKSRLQAHMWPGQVTKLAALPRTSSGKIDRANLKGKLT